MCGETSSHRIKYLHFDQENVGFFSFLQWIENFNNAWDLSKLGISGTILFLHFSFSQPNFSGEFFIALFILVGLYRFTFPKTFQENLRKYMGQHILFSKNKNKKLYLDLK